MWIIKKEVGKEIKDKIYVYIKNRKGLVVVKFRKKRIELYRCDRKESTRNKREKYMFIYKR